MRLQFECHYKGNIIGICEGTTSHIPLEGQYIRLYDFKGVVNKVKPSKDKKLVELHFQRYQSKLINRQELQKPCLFYPIHVIFCDYDKVTIGEDDIELVKWIKDFEKTFLFAL